MLGLLHSLFLFGVCIDLLCFRHLLMVLIIFVHLVWGNSRVNLFYYDNCGSFDESVGQNLLASLSLRI